MDFSQAQFMKMVEVLRQAESALVNSVPKCPHYPEAHVDHAKALAAVRDVLEIPGDLCQ